MFDSTDVELVSILWKDAALHGVGQFSKDSEELGIINGLACGILVKETDEYITIAMDKFEEGATPFRTCQSYPKSGIIEIKRLQNL